MHRQEEIQEIKWRVDSKISEIVRTPNSQKKNLKFQYDAMGHFVAARVLSVITDSKSAFADKTATFVSCSTRIASVTEYSPFGVALSGRSWTQGYRFGFNGKEKDGENFEGAYDFGVSIPKA